MKVERYYQCCLDCNVYWVKSFRGLLSTCWGFDQSFVYPNNPNQRTHFRFYHLEMMKSLITGWPIYHETGLPLLKQCIQYIKNSLCIGLKVNILRVYCKTFLNFSGNLYFVWFYYQPVEPRIIKVCVVITNIPDFR